MPTRFLDWTENCLAALYFAVYETDTPRDATVWIIHLWSLNICSINLRSVPIISDDIIATYAFRENDRPNIKAELPVAIQPRHTSERIISQKGQFTLHGHDTRGIREMSSSKLRSIDLKRVDISGPAKTRVLEELFMAGSTHATLFPDLDGLSREIALRYSLEFMK